MKVPNRKYKLGDMIYPIENGTASIFKRQYWGVVNKLWKKNQWKEVKWFTCIDCANLYSVLIKQKCLITTQEVKE